MRQEVKTRYRREPASRPGPVLRFFGLAVLLFFLCAYGYELLSTLNLMPNTGKTYPGSELLRVLRLAGFPASLLLVLFLFLKVLRRRRWRFCVIGSLAVLGLLAVGEIIAAFNSRIGFGCVNMEYVIGSSLMAIGVVIVTIFVGKELKALRPWEPADCDVLCGNCGYDLFGTDSKVCPECGYKIR